MLRGFELYACLVITGRIHKAHTCRYCFYSRAEYQISNRKFFWFSAHVLLWTTCIARELFSLVVMGNGKQVLPVLQCLKRGIAFVSSYVLWFPDVGQFKCMLFRMTALLMTSKAADRRLLQHLCIAPVRLFEESVMESAVACWEWMLAARSDLRAQVLTQVLTWSFPHLCDVCVIIVINVIFQSGLNSLLAWTLLHVPL